MRFSSEQLRPNPEPEARWYALYTRHQHERAVAKILSNKGIENFLPQYDAVHRWRDRIKQLSLPLFPCYVFVADTLERRLQILTTPGVLSVVGFGGVPALIPSDEISAIRCAIQGAVRIEPHPFLTHGDRVRIRWGPLAGVEGILVRRKNLFRLVLSVEMLGKSAAVDVDAATVEYVTPAHLRSVLPTPRVAWSQP